MKKIAIIGSGSWGTALGVYLAKNGNDVKLWSFSEEEKRIINEEKNVYFYQKLLYQIMWYVLVILKKY